MGSVCSSNTVVEGVADKETERIDRLLEEQKSRDNLHFKILILGAGESGKSTIVKQLTFIHKQSITKEEKLSYVKVLQNNTVQCMVTLIKEAEGFGYSFTNAERAAADSVCSHDQRAPMPADMCDAIELLWSCPAIQKTYERKNEFWHLEATEYYFKNAMRFVEDGYIPSEEDIVMARKRTTGVVVTELDYGSVHWSVVDVGGQRSERRKWLNCFDGVRAIIYVVNLAGYCKVLFEDKAVNRMHESLNLFEATLSNPLFQNTPVFLFLNKKDLFEELIRTQNIDCCFPEYSGTNELKPCIEYISDQFQRRLPHKHSRALVLLLAARMKKDVQYCFEEVKDILIDMHKKQIQKAIKELERVEKRNKADLYKSDEEAEDEVPIKIKDASRDGLVVGNGALSLKETAKTAPNNNIQTPSHTTATGTSPIKPNTESIQPIQPIQAPQQHQQNPPIQQEKPLENPPPELPNTVNNHSAEPINNKQPDNNPNPENPNQDKEEAVTTDVLIAQKVVSSEFCDPDKKHEVENNHLTAATDSVCNKNNPESPSPSATGHSRNDINTPNTTLNTQTTITNTAALKSNNSDASHNANGISIDQSSKPASSQ